MSKRDCVSLLIKLTGVYGLITLMAPLLLTTLNLLKSIADARSFWEAGVIVGMSVIFPAIWIGFCIVVIRSSDRIAMRVYRRDQEVSQVIGLSFRDVRTLGYHLLGLLIVVQAVPELIRLFAHFQIQQAFFRRYAVSHENPILAQIPDLLAAFVRLLLGVALFLLPKGLANLWQSAQSMKYRRIMPTDESA